jgi:hypothetical protein
MSSNYPAPKYIPCTHCGAEFLGKPWQVKKYNRTKRAYCSPVCGNAALRKQRKPMPMYTCPTCLVEFGSRAPKRYCSLKCYITSDQFRQHTLAMQPKGNAASVLAQTGRLAEGTIEQPCLNCQATIRVEFGKRGKKKYCSTRCYRAFMAGRFDRWIANPQEIALPQCYDEFLMQDELPCLIDGCDWVGKRLGNHVNFAHGIQAVDFKRAAGFNKKTGLHTPDVAQHLSDRAHIHGATFGGGFDGIPNPIRSPRSLEADEHLHKAQALMREIYVQPERVCESCGVTYQPAPLGWNSRYCTKKCREQWYAKNYQRAQFWFTCAVCKKAFQGNIAQRRRHEIHGKPVFCSTHCRQLNNSNCWRKGRPKGGGRKKSGPGTRVDVTGDSPQV